MKLLKYESFLETMQFAVLTNAQRIAKQEADRKAKQELTSTKETPKTIDTNDDDDYGQEGAEEMEVQTEGDEETDTNYGQEGDEETDTDF
jgi:hypothetical protein